MDGVMKSDAHNNARTASARRRGGSHGPLMVKEAEAEAVTALVARHGALATNTVLPETLLVS